MTTRNSLKPNPARPAFRESGSAGVCRRSLRTARGSAGDSDSNRDQVEDVSIMSDPSNPRSGGLFLSLRLQLREVVPHREAVGRRELENLRLTRLELDPETPDRLAGHAIDELVRTRDDIRELELPLLVGPQVVALFQILILRNQEELQASHRLGRLPRFGEDGSTLQAGVAGLPLLAGSARGWCVETRGRQRARPDQPLPGRRDFRSGLGPVSLHPSEFSNRVVPSIQMRAGHAQPVVEGHLARSVVERLPVQLEGIAVTTPGERLGGQYRAILDRRGLHRSRRGLTRSQEYEKADQYVRLMAHHVRIPRPPCRSRAGR